MKYEYVTVKDNKNKMRELRARETGFLALRGCVVRCPLLAEEGTDALDTDAERIG